MLTPFLLNLYNAAVRSLPEHRKTQERQIAEELDAAYKLAHGRLDKLVNALEKKDEQAIREVLQSGAGPGATRTDEQAALYDAVTDLVFPAPEYVAQSPVTAGNLAQLMESLPPISVGSGANATEPLVPGDIQLPPQSPPASAPVPAVAEPKLEYVCAFCMAPADETKGKLRPVSDTDRRLMHENVCAPPAPAVTPAERPKRKRS